MKKIVPILLAMLLMVTTVFAEAKLPEFLTETYTNYTSEQSITLTFDNSEELVALLKELEMPEEVSNYVDMESLLGTLLAYEGKLYMQVDISDNFESFKLALTSESAHSIDVNSNLNMALNLKYGIWMDLDFSDENQITFDIIYANPILNKYFVIKGEDLMDAELNEMLKTVFNKEYLSSLSETSMDLFAKYATISGSGSKYTVSIDNEGLAGYLDEIFAVIAEQTETMQNAVMGETDTAELDEAYSEDMGYHPYPSFKDWQILGEDGIQCVYSLNGTKIANEKITADISIDIPSIYTATTGEEWPYQSSGKLDFTMEASAAFSDFDSTKVEFPVLTEENSFSLADLTEEVYPEEDTEYIPYPYWSVYEYCDALPVIDGEIYVPFRSTLDSAYQDSVAIDFYDGVITASSEYFTNFNTVTVAIGSDATYTDGNAHYVGSPVLIDGTAYINSSWFTEILGWTFTSARYDLLTETYNYGFRTNR